MAAFEGASQSAAASTPNVVIIFADDLGWGDISAYHSESLIKTPHIDKVTTQGLSFTDARYGLLTGRYCWRTILKKQVLNGYSRLLIDADTPTMPKLFQAKGYKTVKKTIPHNETGQLYDMSKDPYETEDLYEKQPETVKALTTLLEGFKESGRSVKRQERAL